VSEGPFLSVVIPAFEGERVIRQTIDAVQRHAAKRGWAIEIVVGFSRGRDRTEEVLAAARSDYSNMTVVDTTAEFGKGGAVRGAMAATRGRVRCFIDADGGVSFDQIDGALELLKQYDIAVGSRYMPGGSAGRRPLARVVLSRGGNLLMRLVLGLRSTDTRAPLKVYRGAVADRLFPALRLNGFGFDSEFLFLAGKLGYRIVEFPVEWKSGESSSVRVRRDAVRSIFELFEIRWWWLSGHYAALGTRTSQQLRR
jgi:dolichyl-phosphate beta-glucosyltransferase